MIKIKGNKYKVLGNKTIIYATNTNDKILIDTKNLQKVLKYTWYINNHGYIATADYKNNYKILQLHRYILGITNPLIKIDHRDLNPLNNLESNLRVCTQQQNSRNRDKNKNNSSGYKGVYWFEPLNKWVSQIALNGYNIHLGLYDNKKVAAKVREIVEKAIFGEFANPTPVPYIEPETLLNSDKTIIVIDGNTETSINIKLTQEKLF